MLKIRKEQMEVFRNGHLQKFADRMMIHLKKFWPEKCKSLGEKGLRDSIMTGIKNAEKYGIIIEYDVASYIDMMYALCFDFDTNPRTGWAGRILNNRNLPAREKIKKLDERTKQELRMLADRERRGV
jgi:hypothetical protein